MRSAIIYDVKRSLLRPLVLLMLVLFAALGVATTYYAYIFLAGYYPNVEGVAVYIKTSEGNNTRCVLMGGIFDRRGDPVESSLTLITNSSRIYSFKSTSTFIVEDPSICRHNIDMIEISTNLVKLNISCTTISAFSLLLIAPRSAGIYNFTHIASSIFVCGKSDGNIYIGSTLHVFKMFINDLKSWKARLYTFTVNTSSMSVELTKPIVLNYTFSSIFFSSTQINQSQGSIEIRHPIEKFDLSLDPNKDAIQFYSEVDHNLNVAGFDYSYKVNVERSYIELAIGSIGLNLFLEFFPIAVIYISYTLVAKPRSTGALEFVLARPMTRFDLYLSRYLAGAIIIVISSVILSIVLAIFQPLVLRIGLDPWGYMLLYLGILASLLTFHTLCYAIASTTRSGLYLAISITLYILFAMLWSLATIAIAFMLGIKYYEHKLPRTVIQTIIFESSTIRQYS